MNYLPYMQRIQIALGAIRAADGIQEDPWLDTVVRELNAISKDCADELQRDLGVAWNKVTYLQELREAPPPRLLATVLPVVAWLGWCMREKQGDSGRLLSVDDCLMRLRDALESGAQMSRNGQVP